MTKNECKIVRDLFPNYIEGLLSDETKHFVENHIDNCNECNRIMKMIKDEKTNTTNKKNIEEQYELNYLKKFRKKLLTLKSIIIFFVVTILILCATFFIKFSYNQYIIGSAYSKLQEIKNGDNYKLYVEYYYVNYEAETNKELFNYITYYYKDGKYKEEKRGHIPDGVLLNANSCYYGEIDSNKRIEIYKDTNEVINKTANYIFTTKGRKIDQSYTYTDSYGKDNGTLLNLIFKSGLSVKTGIYNGKECYVVSLPGDNISFTEIWIEKETMLVLRELNGEIGRFYYEKKFTIETGTVVEDDLIIPQLDGYTIQNKEETLSSPMLEYYK